MSKVAVKDSKSRILETFQQILAERQKIESKVATKEEEAEKQKNQQVLAIAAQYTTDSIVRGLADLQLGFNTTLGGLSTQLTTEHHKLDELQQAIAIETEHLTELQQIRVVADALHLLTQEHQEKLRVLEQQFSRDRETLDQDMIRTRKLWEQEQAEHEVVQVETSSLQLQERQKQEEDYQYETERSRQISADEYAALQRDQERELEQLRQTKEQNWTEREQVLTTQQALQQEYRQKADAFPTELEEAIKKSREEGIREANQDAKIKADLFEKEWEATQQGYELQVQSLEAKIQRQTEQMAELSNQLQTVLHQAQELAMRAFDSSANSLSKSDRAA